LTVYQVAELTKIKTEHIRALEEGNYGAFTATVYIRGFVRTYATLLKLDLPAILSILDAELSQNERFREPPSLTGESKGWMDFLMLQFSRVNWGWVAPVFLLAALVACGLWGYRTWRSRPVTDPLTKLGAGLYQPSTNLPATTLPLPTNSQIPRKL
jgi:cytoskeletal protein RodZ